MKAITKNIGGLSGHRIVALLCLVMTSITVHAAITPEETALRRLMELSEISTQASVNEVLALANEGSTFEMRHQFIFTALTRIGPSSSGDAYAKSVLDAGTGSPTLLRGALAYLTEHANAAMVPYAGAYLDESRPGEVRCMAAYLAGALGLAAHKATIVAILQNPSYDEWRLHAAMGLAYLASVNEFTALLDGTNLRDADKQIVKSYNAFLQATDDNKATMLSSMFGRAHISLQLIALRYLLQNNKTDLLKQLGIVTGDDATVSMRTKPYEAMARILGYQVSGNINALVIGTRALQ